MWNFGGRRSVFLILLGVSLVLGGCFLLAPPAAPGNVDASDGVYPEYVLVRWEPVRRASAYEVFRATAEEGDYERLGETPTARFEDTTAAPNVRYWYRVRAKNPFGASPLSQADSGYRLGPVPPAPPTNVQASDGTFPDRIRVAWEAAIGAGYYEVYRSDVPGADFIRIAQTSATSYEDREVVIGRPYYYKVKACNNYGCSDFSEVDSGQAAAEAPAAPANVQASDGTYSDRVRVTWSAVPGAARYEVHRATSRDGTYELLGETAATTYDDTGVALGTTYWYKVRAGNVFGYGPFSEPDSGYAAAGGGGGGGGGALLPGQPWNLAATDGDYDDKIVITWSGASGAKRYELWRAPASGPTEPPENEYSLLAETTSTSYTDTERGLCELYWYKVRAWNEYGFGPWSFADSGYMGGALGTVDASKIKVVVLPPAVENGNYQVYLEWPNVKNADKYDVKYEIWRRGTAGYSVKIDEAPRGDPATYTDATVSPGNTYYYKIRAVSEGYANLLLPNDGSCPTCGECITRGGFSGEVVAVVSCNPLAPELKTADFNPSTGKVTLTWKNPYAGTAVESAATFRVWRSRSSTSYTEPYTYIGEVSSGGTTFTDAYALNGLEPGKTYTISYRVKTCFGCGCGVFSNTKSVTVTAP